MSGLDAKPTGVVSELAQIRRRLDEVKRGPGRAGAGTVWADVYVEDVGRLLAEVKQLKSDLELVIRENAVGYDRLKQENVRLLAIIEAAERVADDSGPPVGPDSVSEVDTGLIRQLRAALAAVDAPAQEQKTEAGGRQKPPGEMTTTELEYEGW